MADPGTLQYGMGWDGTINRILEARLRSLIYTSPLQHTCHFAQNAHTAPIIVCSSRTRPEARGGYTKVKLEKRTEKLRITE